MARLQQKSRRQSPQVGPDQPAFPARWFYGLYVLFPVTFAWLPPSPARRVSIFATLSACFGAPEPHDFAVRLTLRSSNAQPKRPPHPAPNVRDDREAPLLWVRDGGKNTHFPIFRKRNIRARRADSPDQVESV